MFKLLKYIKKLISYKKYELLLKIFKKHIVINEIDSNYIIENYKKILVFLDEENIFMFLNKLPARTLITLLSTKKFYNKFKNKLDFIMLLDTTKNLRFQQVYTIFSKYYNYHCYKQFFEDLIKFRMINFIITNFRYIKTEVSLDIIILNLKSIRDELSKIEIDAITDEIIKSVVKLPCLYKIPNYRENIDFISIKIIFNEILKNEGKSIFDLELIGSGSYSSAYNIGDKVIKFGRRLTPQIPDDKRLLASILRREFDIEDFNESVFIEITEIVDTLSYNVDLSTAEKNEIVYSIFKELRKKGKIWADPRIANVGILRKDNKIYFDGIDSVDKESLGYIKETINDDEVLKVGDYVILDKDIIYLDKDFDYEKLSKIIKISNYDSMEKRYQKENQKS